MFFFSGRILTPAIVQSRKCKLLEECLVFLLVVSDFYMYYSAKLKSHFYELRYPHQSQFYEFFKTYTHVWLIKMRLIIKCPKSAKSSGFVFIH